MLCPALPSARYWQNAPPQARNTPCGAARLTAGRNGRKSVGTSNRRRRQSASSGFYPNNIRPLAISLM